MRSATFDAVINHELEAQGITSLDVSSAGLLVEKILANQSPLRVQLKILRAGLAYGLVRDDIRGTVEDVVARGEDQEHTDEIRALYGQVRPMVHGYNIALRNQALAEAGVQRFPAPYTPLDTTRPVDLVVPMVERDVAKVHARFEGKAPRVQTYASLVGTDELVDKIDLGLEGVRGIVEYFMDTRKQAVDALQRV